MKKTFKDYGEDGCSRMAAAMAYYTVFALPPLLLLLLMIAGAVVDPARLQGAIQDELAGAIGTEAARSIETMLRSVQSGGTGGVLATILSLAGVVVGATGVFIQLQEALNIAWEVDTKKKRGIRGFVMKRLISGLMVVVCAAVLLASVLLSAAVSAFGEGFAASLPGGAVALQVAQLAVSLLVAALLFAVIFKVVPDAEVHWDDVWVGAVVTAVLFVAGKFAIGLYLARSNPGEVFGAAGSLALILVFVYYASMILFFGAEFTQAWASHHGHAIRPDYAPAPSGADLAGEGGGPPSVSGRRSRRAPGPARR